MSFDIVNISSSLIKKQAAQEIVKLNDYTSRFGLNLTHKDAAELVETRAHALKIYGRIEFGGGVIDKIIKGFCDSPYISRHNYAETLHELTEIFYFYKNETLDILSDDELIKFMKEKFDGVCQGSLEFLQGTVLEGMARSLRSGHDINHLCNTDNERDEDEEDEDGEY
jgi:hypothetical protein